MGPFRPAGARRPSPGPRAVTPPASPVGGRGRACPRQLAAQMASTAASVTAPWRLRPQTPTPMRYAAGRRDREGGGIVQLRRFPFSPSPLQPLSLSSPFVCGFRQGEGREGDTASASFRLHVALTLDNSHAALSPQARPASPSPPGATGACSPHGQDAARSRTTSPVAETGIRPWAAPRSLWTEP